MGTGLRLRARDAKENPAKVLAMVLFIMFIISALLLLFLALLIPAGALGGSCQSGSDRYLYHNGADWRHSDGKKDQG